MNVGKNLGFAITNTQTRRDGIPTTRSGHVMHTMNATGRLTEQATGQWTGKQNARTEMQQVGVMENSQALIPLIGITPDSILFMANAYIYILHVTVQLHQPFHLPM